MYYIRQKEMCYDAFKRLIYSTFILKTRDQLFSHRGRTCLFIAVGVKVTYYHIQLYSSKEVMKKTRKSIN